LNLLTKNQKGEPASGKKNKTKQRQKRKRKKKKKRKRTNLLFSLFYFVR